MANYSNSNSTFQKKTIEPLIVEKLEQEFACVNEKADKLPFTPDFFNANKKIIAEIYAGIDNINYGSRKKILADCLRLLYAEKVFGGKWTKIIALVDDKIKDAFSEKHWEHSIISEFGIKLEVFEIPQSVKGSLREIKKRQSEK
jgi:hypothetical protein